MTVSASTIYTTPGNVGILKKTTYLFVCGGCYHNLEIDAPNLEDAKRQAKSDPCNWRNGFHSEDGAMPGAGGSQTTWRCDECIFGTFYDLEADCYRTRK